MSQFAVKNITVQAEGKEIVTNVSFDVNPGEIHVIMGPNGSGKSSLVNALFGHPKYKITEGKILLDDEDITFLPTDKKAKKGLFLSLQHLPEIDGVTFTNFLFRSHKEMTGKEMTILEFHTYLHEKANEYGLPADFLRRNVNAGLSGGEKKQNEAFQLAFFEPKFAFLDEIDSGVDIDAMEKVFSTINFLRKQGTGFVLITHYGRLLDTIKPDRVHIMKEGRIVKEGGAELAEEILSHGFKNG